MKIGYARVSTTEQRLDLQLDALRRAGCERIFEDTASGKSTDRPGLAQALSHLRAGDSLIVWKLDRLGRTVKGLMALTEQLQAQAIGFTSLQEGIDISTPMGQCFFTIMSAFAELERNLIIERTRAGLEAGRMRGRLGGRPFALTPTQQQLVWDAAQNRETNLSDLAKEFGVHRATINRCLQRRRRREAQQQAARAEVANEKERTYA